MEDPKTRVFERASMEVWGRVIPYDACSLGTGKAISRRLCGTARRRAHDLTTAHKATMELNAAGTWTSRRSAP